MGLLTAEVEKGGLVRFLHNFDNTLHVLSYFCKIKHIEGLVIPKNCVHIHFISFSMNVGAGKIAYWKTVINSS